MSDEAHSIWQLLRQNQAVNAPVFRAACVDVQAIAVLRCPSCDLEESALFWTSVGSSARTLRLACPLCHRSGARYDLHRNRGKGPPDVRRLASVAAMIAAVLVLTAGGFQRYGPPAEEVRHSMQRSLQKAESAAGGARDWMASTVGRHVTRR
jgi:hypothetical protein